MFVFVAPERPCDGQSKYSNNNSKGKSNWYMNSWHNDHFDSDETEDNCEAIIEL